MATQDRLSRYFHFVVECTQTLEGFVMATNCGQERKFQCYGQEIIISANFDYYNALMQMFRGEAIKAAQLFSHKKVQEYNDMYTLAKNGEIDGIGIFKDIIQRCIILGMINEYQIFDVDVEQFYDNYCKKLNSSWHNLFVEKVYKIIAHEEEVYASSVAGRELRKQSDKVIGGGFGFEGYLKGATEAFAINTVKGAGHSVVNAVGNFFDRDAAKSRLNDAFFRFNAYDEMYNHVLRLLQAYWLFLSQRNIVSSEDMYFKEGKLFNLPAKVEGFLKNIKNIPVESAKRLFPQMLSVAPYFTEFHKRMFIEFGDSNGQLFEISKYLGVDFIAKHRLEILDVEYEKLLVKFDGNPRELKVAFEKLSKQYDFVVPQSQGWSPEWNEHHDFEFWCRRKTEEIEKLVSTDNTNTERADKFIARFRKNYPLYVQYTKNQQWKELCNLNDTEYATFLLKKCYRAIPAQLEPNEIVMHVFEIPGHNELCIITTKKLMQIGDEAFEDPWVRAYPLCTFKTAKDNVHFVSTSVTFELTNGEEVYCSDCGQKAAEVAMEMIIGIIHCNAHKIDLASLINKPKIAKSSGTMEQMQASETIDKNCVVNDLHKEQKNATTQTKKEPKIYETAVSEKLAASKAVQPIKAKTEMVIETQPKKRGKIKKVVIGIVCSLVVLFCLGAFLGDDNDTSKKTAEDSAKTEVVAEKKPESQPTPKKQTKADSAFGVLLYEATDGKKKGTKCYFLPESVEWKSDGIAQVSTTLVPAGEFADELEKDFGENVAHIDTVFLLDIKNRKYKTTEVTAMREGGVIDTDSGDDVWCDIKAGSNTEKLFNAIQQYLPKIDKSKLQQTSETSETQSTNNNPKHEESRSANLRKISGTKVNMRSAPGKGANVIFQFPGYESVTVLEEANPNNEPYPWYKVSYEGHTGWVYGQFVK